MVGGADCHLEVRVADVEVEEAVLRAVKFEELAAIATPFHAAAEGGDFLEGSDPVGLSVHQQYGRELAAYEAVGAESLGYFFVREALGQLAFRGGVDHGAEQYGGFRSLRYGGILAMLLHRKL